MGFFKLFINIIAVIVACGVVMFVYLKIRAIREQKMAKKRSEYVDRRLRDIKRKIDSEKE